MQLDKDFLSYGTLDEAQWAAAVAFLRTKLKEKDRQQIIREVRREGLERWVDRNHFPFGMTVRNILRQGGFTEERLGILDLDMAWGLLLGEALGLSERPEGNGS